MPDSIVFDVGAAPADIVAVAGLTQGTVYTLQNIGVRATLFMREASTAPAAGDPAFRIEASGHATIQPQGTPIYVWADEPVTMILSEAA